MSALEPGDVVEIRVGLYAGATGEVVSVDGSVLVALPPVGIRIRYNADELAVLEGAR